MLKAREKNNNASGKMFTALQSKYLFLLLTNAKAVAFTIGGCCFLSTRSWLDANKTSDDICIFIEWFD